MTYRIAEVAELVGVPTTTLRYYEDIGLVDPPARGDNGYRTYTDADVDRLRFVTATKRIGIPLSDVGALVKAYDVEDCAVVAHHAVELVAARLVETQTRIGELVALAAELQRVATRLADAPAAGPCGPTCPCATAADAPGCETTAATSVTTTAPPADRSRTFVELTRGPVRSSASSQAPVACSLDAASVPGRVEDWQALVARAVGRVPLPGGVALVFEATPGLAAEVASLAAAEQGCCAFFTFTVVLTTGRVRLEVQAPPDAADVVAAMFGPTG